MNFIWPDDIPILERRAIINSQFARQGEENVKIIEWIKEGQSIYALGENNKKWLLTAKAFGKLPPITLHGKNKDHIPAQSLEIDVKLFLEPIN